MGIDRKGIDIVDGSGLSMQNALTTGFVTDLLFGMRNNADFRKALPVAGRDGTLKGRMRGTPAEGRVLAKTGTLTVASSLSGYALTLGGEDIAFSILMNQFDRTSGARRAREIQDSIAQLLVRIAPPKR
jgi:D-alanyl-D-alanine carboxypeptidase/D-alanyl-D-alanine-endopeptidase (penicillin-binding protein 4)